MPPALPRRPPNPVAQIRELIEDLVALEVTTIVVDEIEVASMPDWPQALDRLEELAETELERARAASGPAGGLESASGGETRRPLGSAPSGPPPPTRHFESLRKEVQAIRQESRPPQRRPLGGLESTGSTPPEATSEAAPEPRISLGNRLRLRRLWTRGRAQVAAHSIIGIDGDVTSTLSSRVLAEHGHGVLELHQLSVKASMEHWRSLVEMAGALVGGLINVLKPK